VSKIAISESPIVPISVPARHLIVPALPCVVRMTASSSVSRLARIASAAPPLAHIPADEVCGRNDETAVQFSGTSLGDAEESLLLQSVPERVLCAAEQIGEHRNGDLHRMLLDDVCKFRGVGGKKFCDFLFGGHNDLSLLHSCAVVRHDLDTVSVQPGEFPPVEVRVVGRVGHQPLAGAKVADEVEV